MKAISLALGMAIALCAPIAAEACELQERYIARLSAMDHFNSNGVRLTSAAAIIRQDRANFHLFGKRDPEDQGDAFFASKGNREILERLLESGRSAPSALREVINGTPIIEVEICKGPSGTFVNVVVR